MSWWARFVARFRKPPIPYETVYVDAVPFDEYQWHLDEYHR